MDNCWFDEVESWSIITALAEVGVLIYCAGYKAWDLGDGFGIGAEDEGEGCGE